MSNYDVGKRIRYFRAKYDLSQEQLALMADITPAYLGQIERNERNPTVKLIEKITNALGITLSELFSDHFIDKDSDEILNRITLEVSVLSESEKDELLKIIRDIIKFKSL